MYIGFNHTYCQISLTFFFLTLISLTFRKKINTEGNQKKKRKGTNTKLQQMVKQHISLFGLVYKC